MTPGSSCKAPNTNLESAIWAYNILSRINEKSELATE